MQYKEDVYYYRCGIRPQCTFKDFNKYIFYVANILTQQFFNTYKDNIITQRYTYIINQRKNKLYKLKAIIEYDQCIPKTTLKLESVKFEDVNQYIYGIYYKYRNQKYYRSLDDSTFNKVTYNVNKLYDISKPFIHLGRIVYGRDACGREYFNKE